MLELITLGRLQLVRNGTPPEPVHVQPKRLALLAYLALAARDGFLSRDTLLATFWPNADQHSARRCLRQAVFHLRNALGDGVLLGSGHEAIALAPAGLWCDAVGLEAAAEQGRYEEVLELFGGDFLPHPGAGGCSTELQEWVEATRRRLRAHAATAAWALVEEALEQGRTETARETARRAWAIAADDEHALRRYMLTLARLGDRAAALEKYAEFALRLRREFDAEPSRKSRRLAQLLREDGGPEAPEDAGEMVAAGPAPESAEVDRRAPVRRAGWTAMATGVLLVGVVHFAGLDEAPRSSRAGHVLVTDFNDYARDSLLAVAVTEALRADLSRVAEVREDRRPQGNGNDSALAVVTGDIAKLGPGYTVSARLLSPATGRVLSAVREDAPDSTHLLRTIARLSHRLRADLGRVFPTRKAATVGIR